MVQPKTKKKSTQSFHRRAGPARKPSKPALSSFFSRHSRKASWTAMCLDPSVQGRCREQARPAGQVRNHCDGPAPRRTPVSTAHAFSFFAPCLSQLLHRAQRSLPCPCSSFRSPSPIANSLAWPGFANYSLFPGEDDHSPCPVMLSSQSPPVSIFSEYSPKK